MRAALAIALLLAAYLWVSHQGYVDALQQAKHCADMVQAGAWPAEACK